MCLKSIFVKKPKVSGFGYKLFDTVPGRKELASFYRDDIYKKGRWYTSRGVKVSLYDSVKFYQSGFHIFKSWRPAGKLYNSFNWHKSPTVIYRVQYRGAKICGNDEGGGQTIVAKQMKILERVK